MADEPASPAPAPDYSDRVDALLSSALADQAKEKRQLVETLYGAKTALGRAEQGITALKDLIATRDEELLTAIDERLTEAKDFLDRRFDSRIADLEDAIIKIAKSVAQVPTKVRSDLESAAVAIGERMGEEIDTLLRTSREDAVEVVSTFSKVSDRSVSQLREAVDGAREEYRTTTEQLASYLGQRDDSLQRSRDQVLVDLFRQLGESLGKRNAKKVAGAIAEDSQFGRTPVDSASKQPRGQGGVLKVSPPPGPPYQGGPPAYQPQAGSVESSLSTDRPSRSVPEPFAERFGDSSPAFGTSEQAFGGESSFDEYGSQPAAGQPTMANPLTRKAPARDYLIPVFPSQEGPRDEGVAAQLFGAMAADDAAPKRRRKTKPPEELRPKPPAKRPSRRTP